MSEVKQYYVAVGCAQSKLVTLIDFVKAVLLETRDQLLVGVCCSTRDACDEVIAALVPGSVFKAACWHADANEADLVSTALNFREDILALGQQTGEDDDPALDKFVHPDDVREQRMFRDLQRREGVQSAFVHVLVCTDAGLKAVPQDVLPVSAHLLINYDLPRTKEHHHRRMVSLLGGGGSQSKRAVIHFVVAGQMTEFRTLEKFTNAAIHEMPVHAADILLGD